MRDSFGARSVLTVGARRYAIYRLEALARAGHDVGRLPYSLRVLLENLLRHEDGAVVTRADIEALAGWDPRRPPEREIAYTPARTLLQDFTGVPAIVDLAAMRDAMAALGGDPARINPLQPVELVIDHSIQVDAFGGPEAFQRNVELDYARNAERYAFLRWGQQAFANFRVVPPNTGIVHQVNLEYLARVVFSTDESAGPAAAGPAAAGPNGTALDELPLAYPDTCVGTDSHTPMVNGLSVLAWGVGGIEAEAAMLGQPITMLIPEVLGFRLTGSLPAGTTATDLVLTVTEMLRRKGVVGKFVEFYGPGVASLALADRATIGNMSPEYGATCAIFPPDQVTIDYLRFTGRPPERIALVETYLKAQGLFHAPGAPEPAFTDTLALDLSTVEPSVAGPRRPQDRIPLSGVRTAFRDALPDLLPAGAARPPAAGEGLDHGAVVIAAITSCTNTSNPPVMLAAGLLARKAVERGLRRRPWVKTSLAPGSKVVTDYYRRAGLTPYLEALGFNLVGYGCTTCIGNSGPLPPEVSAEIAARGLVACAALSGNRNFEGRIHAEVRANFLMSPPLVVAYALAGRIDWDPVREPIGHDPSGEPVFLRDIWPSPEEIQAAVRDAVESEMFRSNYGDVFSGDERWRSMEVPAGDRFAWDDRSSYVRRPPYFVGMERHAPGRADDLRGARVLAWLGDSVTTDHISPAGSIRKDSPAGRHLIERGIDPADFNSYGARRGNHEVMIRGTFANHRIRNRLAPGTEGGVTPHLPSGELLSIYDAAVRYQQDGTPLLLLAGREYGSGSSRDWAAKGPQLQGVRAVLAVSYERIHRSNLVGMGILPLQFLTGETPESLGLSGRETFDVLGVDAALDGAGPGAARRGADGGAGRQVTVRAAAEDGTTVEFRADLRIDTPQEARYYRHGGILPFVLRQLLEPGAPPAHGGLAAGAITGASGADHADHAGRAADAPGTPRAPRGSSGAEPAGGNKVNDASRDSFPASDPPGY